MYSVMYECDTFIIQENFETPSEIDVEKQFRFNLENIKIIPYHKKILMGPQNFRRFGVSRTYSEVYYLEAYIIINF